MCHSRPSNPHPDDLVEAFYEAVRAGSLLKQAKAMLAVRVPAYRPDLTDEQLTAVIDVVVRTVLSHVMQPSDTPARTADALAWVAARVLGLDTTTPLRHR